MKHVINIAKRNETSKAVTPITTGWRSRITRLAPDRFIRRFGITTLNRNTQWRNTGHRVTESFLNSEGEQS